MSALIGMLGSIWPYLAAGLAAIGGLLYGFVKGQRADTKVAQAQQQTAAANQATAEAKAQTAAVRDGEAQANATAAAAGANSVKERANVETDVGALPAGSAAGQLRDDWAAGPSESGPAGGAGQDAGH